MPTSRVLRFRDLDKPLPAKARLRADVALSVSRSTQKLPILGERNPDAALLIERTIDDWTPPPSDGGVEVRDRLGDDAERAPSTCPPTAEPPVRLTRLMKLPRIARPTKWVSKELAVVNAILRAQRRGMRRA